ncbi:MAG TPA: restriction endonuclease [Burkholderiales bacterium]
MNRRTRTTALADFFELISAMPWWLGVLLAGGSYAGFHFLAERELAGPRSAHDYAQLSESLIKAWSAGLQYALPALFLAGAGVSALIRLRRGKRVVEDPASEHVAALKAMSQVEFETLTAEGFRMKGFIVKERRGRIDDGRADLELVRGPDRALVHWKQWRAARVSMESVREFHALMSAKAASLGFFLTAGQFSENAREFARGRGIELIDGARLYAMFHDVRMAQTVPEQASAAKALAEPDCPKCGAKMVKRVAKQGAKRGQAFWGCSTYPACSGARPI